MTEYTFGDDGTALLRLRLVASAYEPASRAFLGAHVEGAVGVALDLGCGPGFSTELVGELCAPRTLIGIDSSAEFLEVARARLPAARFETRDAALTPLPGAPADVIYARLVLAHLSDPLAVAEGWRAQLSDRGVLLIEDLEEIDAPPGPLRVYDDVSADIVRSGGGLMYAGPALARLGGRCVAVTVPAAVAARIYLFNVRRWRADPARRAYRRRLAELEDDLSAVVSHDRGTTVSWIVRQIAVRP